eukprot:2926287-Pyramimonas_sp.AAC.1
MRGEPRGVPAGTSLRPGAAASASALGFPERLGAACMSSKTLQQKAAGRLPMRMALRSCGCVASGNPI